MKEKDLKRECYRIAIFMSVFFLLFGLTGCRADADAQMNKTIDTLVKAIQENDSDTIVQLFSEAVREEVGDEELVDGVEYLHSILIGDVLATEINSGIKGENNYGEIKQRILNFGARVTTNSGEYVFRVVLYTKDNSTPDYTGMYSLVVFKEPVRDFLYIKNDFVGIYVPRTVDESERNIPHKFNPSFGSFTVPSGYYKDDSISTDDKYFFTVEDVVLSDAIYNCFSVTFTQSEYGIDETDTIQSHLLKDLNDSLNKIRDPYGTFYVESDISVEENPAQVTAQGYPLLRYTIVADGKPIDEYIYIIGDKKWIKGWCPELRGI